MFTTNVLGSFTESLLAFVDQLEGKAKAYVEFESGDSDIMQGFLTLLGDARLKISELQLAHESISANVNLSASGQLSELTKVIKAIHEQLTFLGKKAKERREAFETERAALFALPKPPSGDPVVNYLKEQELRERMRRLPLSGRMRAYAEAVTTNESTLIRAVKDPAFASELLADDQFAEYIARVDREKIERGQPKQWARVRSLELSAEWLMVLWNTVDMQMANYGKLPVFTPKVSKTGTMNLGFKDQTAPPAKSPVVDKPAMPLEAFL